MNVERLAGKLTHSSMPQDRGAISGPWQNDANCRLPTHSFARELYTAGVVLRRQYVEEPQTPRKRRSAM